MKVIKDVKIKTGKDLIESNIFRFEVLNGCWIGRFYKDSESEEYILECMDYDEDHIVNKRIIKEDTKLDFDVKVLELRKTT